MAPDILVPFLAAALLNLDRRAFLHSMLGRPLCAGALMGALCGLPAQGLALGLWSEFLWFWSVPVGGSHTPNPGLAVSAAVLTLRSVGLLGGLAPDAVASRLLAPGAPSPEAWAATVLAFALLPATARFFILPDKLNRSLARETVERLEGRLKAGGDPSLFLANLRGLLETFALSLAFLAFAVLVSTILLWLLLHNLPPWALSAFASFAPYAPLLAFLGVAASLSRRSLSPYLLGLACGVIIFAFHRFQA
jgi:mannose/fructose/N-acetylgalactosamine-specific phosphotransferase system component IIC